MDGARNTIWYLRQTCNRYHLLHVHSQRCWSLSSGVTVLRSSGLVSPLVRPAARAFPSRSVTPLPPGRVNDSRRLTAALIFRSWFTVVKMVDFSYKPSPTIPADAVPTVQDDSTRDSHPGTPNGSPFKPPHVSFHPRQPEPDWVSPADAALGSVPSSIRVRSQAFFGGLSGLVVTRPVAPTASLCELLR